MTDQAWERFEHSGSIADYLQYKENNFRSTGSQTGTVEATQSGGTDGTAAYRDGHGTYIHARGGV